MKIYTKTGDRGETTLFGGERVPKSHPRIAAYGTVDELNSLLGVACEWLDREAVEALRRIQNDLFNLGAELATPPENEKAFAYVTLLKEERIRWLESEIDRMDAALEPMNNFILPGGSKGAAFLHLARTVCRRAERKMVELAADTPFRQTLIEYVNRLSDYFFVLARYVNKRAGIADIPWTKG